MMDGIASWKPPERIPCSNGGTQMAFHRHSSGIGFTATTINIQRELRIEWDTGRRRVSWAGLHFSRGVSQNPIIQWGFSIFLALMY